MSVPEYQPLIDSFDRAALAFLRARMAAGQQDDDTAGQARQALLRSFDALVHYLVEHEAKVDNATLAVLEQNRDAIPRYALQRALRLARGELQIGEQFSL
jgi:hypothetical protein